MSIPISKFFPSPFSLVSIHLFPMDEDWTLKWTSRARMVLFLNPLHLSLYHALLPPLHFSYILLLFFCPMWSPHSLQAWRLPPEVPSAWYTLYRVNFHISRVNNHLMPESILDHFVYVRSPTVGLFFVAVLHSGLQCLVIILYPAHVIVSWREEPHPVWVTGCSDVIRYSQHMIHNRGSLIHVDQSIKANNKKWWNATLRLDSRNLKAVVPKETLGEFIK